MSLQPDIAVEQGPAATVTTGTAGASGPIGATPRPLEAADLRASVGPEAEPERRGWFRRRGYFAKFVISFLGLVVLILVVNGALETWFVYRDTTQFVRRTLADKAAAVGRRVEQSLSEAERQISWATRASATTIEQRQADYLLLLQQTPVIDRAVYLDGTGRERLRVSRQEVVLNSGLDYSGDPRFREAQDVRIWWSPVYFNGREPFLVIAAQHSGRNAGSTVAEVNLRFLADLIDKDQTGEDTIALIVDKAGRLLAETGSDEALGTDMTRLPQVAAALKGDAAPASGFDPDGTSVLTAAAAIPRLNFHILFDQQLTTALRPIYGVMIRTLGLLAVGMLLAVLAGMLLARSLVAPIKTLQTGARRLESDLSHRIDVRTGDEIEEFARQFNRMAAQMEEAYGRLEQKVAERTRDLARSNDELKALEEVGRAVAASLDVRSVMRTVVTRAVEVSHADAGMIYRLDPASGLLELAETCGLPEAMVEAARAGPLEATDGRLGLSGASRAVTIVTDLSRRPDIPHQAVLLKAGFRSGLLVPLVGQDALIGALVLLRGEAGQLPAADFMQTFADQAVLALSNARLFQEVEQKGRELSVASEHKSQFLANMSHELRTPLNAVLGYAELLGDGLYGEMPEKAVDVLERIQANGRQLLGLINDVLDISKIEAGQLTLSLDDYSVEGLVHTVVSATESLARTKGIGFTTDVAPGLPLAHGDERRLMQVLTNLVSNAIKFTEAGSVDVAVRLEGEAFRIGVRDTGPGIAPVDQGKIFEEFQQVDSSSTRNKGGTGLGLAIARRLIRLHGGRIDLDSALGVGSTFTIVLPVKVERQDPPRV